MNPDTGLLGALLAGYSDVDRIAEVVHPSDFREPRDELLYTAILRVHHAGNRVDPLTTRAALDAETLSKLPGGPIYLADLMGQCPNVLEAPEYARQVRQNKQRRDLLNAFQVGHEELNNLDRNPVEVGERARDRIDAIVADRGTHAITPLGEVMPDVIDVAEKGQQGGISTPWPDIDRLTRGMMPGRLVVVGARPGVGKSVMGTNLALHVATRYGHGTVISSIEMPRIEVGQRLLAAHASVSLSSLDNGKMSESEWKLVESRVDEMNAMPIDIEDGSAQTVATIRAAVRHAQKRRTVALVVVDYLQLMTARDTRINRVEQVGEFSRGLKQLARETGTCVVAMAQVNRASTFRKDGRPTLADLRESGAIEADADVVILLHRPDDELPDVEAIVAKNRSGPKGEAHLQMQGHYARLVSASRWHTEESA